MTPTNGQAEQLAELLALAGERHHEAFADTDGDDPEWALWYAEFLHGRIDSLLGTSTTRSRLVQCLMNAADAHMEREPAEPWPSSYARFILGLGPAGTDADRSPPDPTAHD